MSTANSWTSILEDARRYPSPHNSQPIKVQILDDARAHVFYDLDRGLPAENLGIPFGHVCAGVFLESVRVVAAGHGFTVSEDRVDTHMDFDSTRRLHPIATLTLAAAPISNQARADLSSFRRRQTSRRPYDARLVPETVVDAVQRIAVQAGHQFGHTTDPTLVRRIIRVNQETLFDDLRNDAVHQEIMTWLRTSPSEAARTGDGLSAQTMLMPGSLLRYAMQHRELWDRPVIGPLFRGAYLNTMRGVRQLGWLVGDFSTPSDYVEAGATFMRIWIRFTGAGVHLHPFGTVITNPRSHQAFVREAGVAEADGEQAWMLFRFGYSKPPPQAHRRQLQQLVTTGETP